ncbi:hypothetical protein JCM8097_006585 [Rhodosporidiobolus ruineniae]
MTALPPFVHEEAVDKVVEAGNGGTEAADELEVDEEEPVSTSLKRRRSASTASTTPSRRCRRCGTDCSALRTSTTSPAAPKKEERASSGAETLPSPTPSSSVEGGDVYADEGEPASVRRIAVPGVAFSTLEAFLTWSSFVFAPLRFADQVKHQAFVQQYKEEHPTRPRPVSPRSVYRLAERFGLTALENLALAELEKQLTPRVAIDLVLETDTRSYPEVKKLVFGYIGDNRKKIKCTSAWAALPGRTTAATSRVYGELLSHLYAVGQEAKKAARDELAFESDSEDLGSDAERL